jgi:hypothetical protein
VVMIAMVRARPGTLNGHWTPFSGQGSVHASPPAFIWTAACAGSDHPAVRIRTVARFDLANPWSLLGCEVVAPPALERLGGRRDRTAQSDTGTTGVGGSGAILYESRDHRHAAGVYRSASPRSAVRASRISQCGTHTISLADGGRAAFSTRRARALARRSRLRLATSWRARKASAALPNGLSPHANPWSSEGRWVDTWTRTANAGRSSSATSASSGVSTSSTCSFSALRGIMVPVDRSRVGRRVAEGLERCSRGSSHGTIVGAPFARHNGHQGPSRACRAPSVEAGASRPRSFRMFEQRRPVAIAR